MSEKDKEDLRWALRLRVDMIALSFVRSAEDIKDVHADHGRGGRAPARHRQDREAAGRGQPRRDHPRLRRRHGGPRRPRRRAAARGGAAGAEARRRDRPAQRQAGHRRDPGARVDDRAARARPAPRPPTPPTRCSTAPTRSCSPARPASAPTRSRRCRRWPASSRAPRSTAWSGSARSAPRPSTIGGAVAAAAVEIGDLLGAKYLITFTQSGDSAKRLSRMRPSIPMLAFTPEQADAHPARPDLGHRDLPRRRRRGTPTRWPCRSTRRCSPPAGVLKEGDLVVIVAGSPPGIPGSTNALRVHRIGDAMNKVAPAYRTSTRKSWAPRPDGAEALTAKEGRARLGPVLPACPLPCAASGRGGRVCWPPLSRSGAPALRAGRSTAGSPSGGMADTEHSKCSARKGVRVQVPPSAPPVGPTGDRRPSPRRRPRQAPRPGRPPGPPGRTTRLPRSAGLPR